MKQKNKKSVRGKIGVAKGFGPGHAENSKEGEDLTQVNTDTVPAMLTPREAVLNRNAAELAGRGTIEKLNSEGNKLARKGVDLAAGGDDDVTPYPMRLPFEGAEAAQEETAQRNADLMQELEDKLRARGVPPLRGLSEGEEAKDTGHAIEGYQVLAKKGTSDMKSKVKQSKPAQSGSPYVQAFQNLMPKGGAPVGYQGGGDSVPGMGGGLGARDQYGRQFSNRDASGGFASGNGVPPSPFPGRGPGGVYPGTGLPMAGGVPAGRPGVAGFGPPAFPGSGGVTPPSFTGPNNPFPGRGPGGVYPGGPMATPLADGTSNVGPIGTPPQGEQAYGPPVNLTAPQIQRLAQQTGISPGQIMGLMKAFQGGKDIYNSVGTGGYDTASPATSQAVGDAFGFGAQGMQGGISDIGYPPFVAPSASYDGNRGGWLGPYDPSFMIQRYAGGTSYVSPFR